VATTPLTLEPSAASEHGWTGAETFPHTAADCLALLLANKSASGLQGGFGHGQQQQLQLVSERLQKPPSPENDSFACSEGLFTPLVTTSSRPTTSD